MQQQHLSTATHLACCMHPQSGFGLTCLGRVPNFTAAVWNNWSPQTINCRTSKHITKPQARSWKWHKLGHSMRNKTSIQHHTFATVCFVLCFCRIPISVFHRFSPAKRKTQQHCFEPKAQQKTRNLPGEALMKPLKGAVFQFSKPWIYTVVNLSWKHWSAVETNIEQHMKNDMHRKTKNEFEPDSPRVSILTFSPF